MRINPVNSAVHLHKVTPSRWASPLLISGQVTVTGTHFADSLAAAGTALLLGTAALPAFQPDPAAASAPREIEVVASRFAFEPARIEVTEGEHVRLIVRSADGVHGVAIKKFRVEETIPRGGTPVTIDFVASAPGEFPLLCSEYCGKGHDDMKGMLVVTAQE